MSEIKYPMNNLNGHPFVDTEARELANNNAKTIGSLSEEKANAFRVASGERVPTNTFTRFFNKISGQPLNVVSTINYKSEGITSLTLQQYGRNLLVPPYEGFTTGKMNDGNLFATVLEDGRIHFEGTTVSSRAAYFILRKWGEKIAVETLISNRDPGYLTDNILRLTDGVFGYGHKPYAGMDGNSVKGEVNIPFSASSTHDVILAPMLEFDNGLVFNSTYEKGKRTDYTVEFGQTIHGGMYDWTTGILTVTHDANGELAQPYTLTFEPQTIMAYDGQNNLYSGGVGYNDITALEPVFEADTEFVVPGNYTNLHNNTFTTVYFEGDTSAMSKDNAVTLKWLYRKGNGTCKVKWQGSSSIGNPKKNYTVTFDQAFEAVTGWGAQSKYCLKANYIDYSHARNVCCAKLWGQVVASRNNVHETLAASPNKGAVDGFPVAVVLNGKFHGLYTWNIPKDAWMANMGNGEQEAILCANGTDLGYMTGAATVGTDFDLEYVTDEANAGWVQTSLNNLINALVNSNGSDLDTTVAQYLDWDSAIDLMAFIALIGGFDLKCKNYLLDTYDGVKWIMGAYDMDSTFGNWWTGLEILSAAEFSTRISGLTTHRVYKLIVDHKKEAFKARYAELRAGVMSEANVAKVFDNFTIPIPSIIRDEDARLWPGIPNTVGNNIHQIKDWYRLRCQVIDAEVEAL